MKKASLDPYVAMRSAYMQHRENKIWNRSQQPEDIHAGVSSARDNALQRAADQKAAAISKEKSLAQAREEEQRREQKPRKNAPPHELAEALQAAAENESAARL